MSKTIYVRGGEPVCRHGGGGWLLTALVLAAAGAYYKSQPHKPVAQPAPAPKPKVITVTHEVTRVVHDHPFLTGWQLVLICAIVAVMVVGGLHLARHLR